jgi:TRAP-type C4-dicarboxylate transport system permease small subunit
VAFRAVRAALDGLDTASRWVITVAMAVMAALVVSQVVFRYGFASSIDWAEEAARLAFVWAVFLAIPHGVRSGIHIGIDAVVTLLPDRVQAALFRFSAVLGAVLMSVVLIYAWQVAVYTWPELMPTLNLTAALYYVPILVAALHSVLHLLLLAWGGRDSWDAGLVAKESPA